MRKKSYASFNNVTVFTLSYAILLVSMRTSYTMSNAMLLKERTKITVLTPPVGLNINNFLLEEPLYMTLELQEDIKHIRLAFQQINPCKATISINKTDIIVVTTNRSLGMAPHI
jgi:hypothetical protein